MYKGDNTSSAHSIPPDTLGTLAGLERLLYWSGIPKDVEDSRSLNRSWLSRAAC
jgi:hypothetical protein